MFIESNDRRLIILMLKNDIISEIMGDFVNDVINKQKLPVVKTIKQAKIMRKNTKFKMNEV
jgi:hypothetical protein